MDSASRENKWLVVTGLQTVILGTFLLGTLWHKYRKHRHHKSHKAVHNEKEPVQDKYLKLDEHPYMKRTHSEDATRKTANKGEVPLYRICLTGGPCAGKTTALTQLREKLADKGFKVFVVPETPTLTMEGGGMIIMGGLTQDKVVRFQSLLMKAQMNLED